MLTESSAPSFPGEEDLVSRSPTRQATTFWIGLRFCRHTWALPKRAPTALVGSRATERSQLTPNRPPSSTFLNGFRASGGSHGVPRQARIWPVG